MPISVSEKIIMDILWKESPITANTIISKLDSELNWQDKTAKTLISRLLKKQAIKYEKTGREYHYFPILKEDDYIEIVSSQFLKRVFSGNAALLISTFAKKEKLDLTDIRELKHLLEKLEHQLVNSGK